MRKCLLILYKLVCVSVVPLPSLTFLFSANYLSMLPLILLLLDLFVVKKFKTITLNKFLYACLIWTNRKLPSIAKKLILYSGGKGFGSRPNSSENKTEFVDIALSAQKNVKAVLCVRWLHYTSSRTDHS
jgi:hypothetical protein